MSHFAFRIVSSLVIALLCNACSLPGLQRVKTVTINGQTDPVTYRYLQHLSKKIEIIGASRYPDMTKPITVKTYIDVEMVINKYGKLVSARLLTPSNNPDLDKQLMEIIHYSAPHPPLPDELKLDRLIIQKRWQFVPRQ
ncbi:MAG: TonB C-terminal domain-containing protein [Thioalkalispiraceae bacterium]|jgi:TonB family protein